MLRAGMLAALILCCANSFVLGQNLTEQKVDDRLQDYEDRLQAVLKTRFPEEKDFVTAVVDRVRDGRLPKSLVDSASLWPRNNRPQSNYPFVYFERVLRLQADKLNISIPPFDYSIYSPGSSTSAGKTSATSTDSTVDRSETSPVPADIAGKRKPWFAWLRFFQRWWN